MSVRLCVQTAGCWDECYKNVSNNGIKASFSGFMKPNFWSLIKKKKAKNFFIAFCVWCFIQFNCKHILSFSCFVLIETSFNPTPSECQSLLLIYLSPKQKFASRLALPPFLLRCCNTTLLRVPAELLWHVSDSFFRVMLFFLPPFSSLCGPYKLFTLITIGEQGCFLMSFFPSRQSAVAMWSNLFSMHPILFHLHFVRRPRPRRWSRACSKHIAGPFEFQWKPGPILVWVSVLPLGLLL